MKIHFPKHCDPKLAEKARKELKRWEGGQVKGKIISRLEMYRLEVGYKYRLVTYNREDWFLMTHQRYDVITATTRGKKQLSLK